jgi:hypothetical protein
MRVITAAGDGSENCIISECVVEAHPSPAHVGEAIMFSFDTSSGYHSFCAIRDCAGRGNTIFEPPPDVSGLDFAAIEPGAGLGTIIEGNQFANVWYGIFASQDGAKDVVISNNYFRNVALGMWWSQGTGPVVGRVIAFDNTVELSRVSSGSVGLELTGEGLDRFQDVILRRNIIRQVPDTLHGLRTNMTGIRLKRCTRLIVENNIINDAGTDPGTGPIRFQECGSAKFFNNQDNSGKLQRGYNVDTSRFVQELEDSVQDVLLPV